MAHKWIFAICFRPQTRAHVWLRAAAVFDPLWLHHNFLLLEEVVQAMHATDKGTAQGAAESMSESSDDGSVASEATALAGKELLQEQ